MPPRKNVGAISLLAPGSPPEMVARTTYPMKRFTAASSGPRFVYVDLSNTWSVTARAPRRPRSRFLSGSMDSPTPFRARASNDIP
jgi:hypothetical protein